MGAFVSGAESLAGRGRLPSAVVLAALCAVLPACPTPPCECIPCVNAVTLSVFDADGNPLNNWLMRATRDGEPINDEGACDPANRRANTCNFGTRLGVYHVVVRADGFKDKEVVARFAAEAGRNCCTSCVPNELVEVFMIPEDS